MGILILITSHIVAKRYSQRQKVQADSLFNRFQNNLILFYDKTTPNNKVLRFVD